MTSSSETDLPEGWSDCFGSRVGRSIIPEESGDGSRAPIASLVGEDGHSSVRIGVVGAKFNGAITLRLLEGFLDCLEASAVDPGSVTVAWVPGAVEIPVVASSMARSGRFDAVACLGAVIRGDTPHFEYVAGPCAATLAQVAVETLVPVVFGVLTTDTVRQAFLRCCPGPANKGWEAAQTALETVEVLRRIEMPSPSGSAVA